YCPTQVIFTFASSQLVDRAGRRVLLLISDSVMAMCLGSLAFYFYQQERGVDVSAFSLVPLVSLGIYISTFALGFGPIPGVMIGELFSPEFKGLAIGIVCVLASLIDTFALGFGPIPGVMIGELFSPEFKGLAIGIVCVLASLIEFFVVKSYHTLLNHYNRGVTFGFFACCCVVGTCFVFFLVPETKNKSLQEIQEELAGKKRTANQTQAVSV
ncbi:facilitated trehalose transporter Tret1-like, partial [Myzus persicae]|uniref:facilitated trehalose transporter Tret1-like n=1 Tax=Myzus persicae TaxID=13164 RepID=UPI000B934CD4